jgi:hypothetical protein
MSLGRRGFLKRSAAVGMGWRSGLVALVWPSRAMASDDRRLTALVDTVVPGRESDPEGSPGAIEAGTVQYLHLCDQRNILGSWIRLRTLWNLALDALDVIAFAGFARGFAALDLEKRTAVVNRGTKIPGLSMLLRLIRAPFYTGTVNRVGWDYLGYPGPNEGFSDYSFGTELSSPHPSSVDGNLP